MKFLSSIRVLEEISHWNVSSPPQTFELNPWGEGSVRGRFNSDEQEVVGAYLRMWVSPTPLPEWLKLRQVPPSVENTFLVGVENEATTLGKGLAVSYTTKYALNIQQFHPQAVTHKLKKKDLHESVHSSSIHNIKNCKKSSCPHEWINTLRSISVVEYYSAIKRNGINWGI